MPQREIESQRVADLPGIGRPKRQRLRRLYAIIAGAGFSNTSGNKLAVDLVKALSRLESIDLVLVIARTEGKRVLTPIPIKIGLNTL